MKKQFKKKKKNWLKCHKFWTTFIVIHITILIISVLHQFEIIK